MILETIDSNPRINTSLFSDFNDFCREISLNLAKLPRSNLRGISGLWYILWIDILCFDIFFFNVFYYVEISVSGVKQSTISRQNFQKFLRIDQMILKRKWKFQCMC